MDKQWVISENVGLKERANALLTTTPIELENAQSLTDGVLEMRQGFLTEDLTGSGLTGPALWMGRFTTNAGVEELWAAANNAGTPALARRVSGTWAPVTFSDTASAANLLYMQGVGMNGKFFLAYDSNVNRLHVWDGTSVRRVGLAQASAVTAATMGGAGLTFNRWYRKRVVVIESGVVTRRSEPSPTYVNVSITDDAGVTVTRGTVPGEGETHWEVEASVDSAGAPTLWYRIATVIIATTTYDDTGSSISTADPTDELGLYIPPPSAKYLTTDGLSLFLAGAWESSGSAGQTTPKQNRVWFTPPLGAADIGDDERIPDTEIQHNWLDVGDAGPLTALGGPVYGETYVFKDHAIGKLTPTGNIESPYALSILTNAVGCVDQRLLSEGEVGGIPALIFANTNAVYALSASGGIACISEPIGRDLRAVTITSDPGLLLFDSFQRSLFLQTSTAPASQAGSYKSFTFDTAKQRWAGFTLGGATSGWILGVSLLDVDTFLGGSGTEIRNGCFASSNDGGRRLYVCGQDANGAATISSWGAQCALDIASTFISKARYRKPTKIGYKAGQVGNPAIWYRNPQGTTAGTLTLTVTYTRDFDESRPVSVVLAPTDDDNGIASRRVELEGLMCADVAVLDATFALSYAGTAYTSEVTPTIDAVVIPYTDGEALAQ
jgi:hypothetical protein